MAAGAQNADPTNGALAATLGPLSEAPEAVALTALDREAIVRWRDERWEALESRAGRLLVRDAKAWYEHLAYERWRENGRTGGLPPAALALLYRVKPLIPRSVQLGLRRRLMKRQGSPAFPAWPYEVAGSDLLQIALADALLDRDVNAVRFPWFWPEGATAAVTLTHDVESAEGLMHASAVAEWEEHRGFRSSFNIVADWYPIDMSQLHRLQSRGHEIGSHAIHHDRSLFSSREAFERQLPLLRDAAERLGAVGFRSPATHRVVEWLAELPFSYDCTMPHSDPYEPIPGGTATTWPFFHRDVVELPYTAPQDHTLFNLLGHRDSALWREQLERIVAGNGLFQLLTHPDSEYLGRPEISEAYRDILETIARRDDVWVALPRDIADWWRRRAQGLTPRTNGTARWTASGLELRQSEHREGVLRAATNASERRSGRVVMVLENSSYPFDSRVRNEAESLTAAGFSVEVLAPREPRRPAHEVVRGVRVTRFPLREGHGALPQTAVEYMIALFWICALVIPRIARSREGTLHVHNPPDVFFPLLWLARLRGWSTVFDHHDDAEGILRDKLGGATKFSTTMAWLRTKSAEAADLTITTNETQRSLVAGHARRTVVVRNAPPSWFSNHKASPPSGRARLVFLGEIGTQDRVDRATEVLAHLVRERGIDAELLIIGDGPERPRVETSVRELRIQDRVTITGFVPYERVPALLATAHVGVDTAAPTEVNQGTTMVKIIEYLVVGLPVVASALRETKVTGADAVIVIDEDRVDAFTEPLARLLTDIQAWDIAATLARERGKELQWDAQAEALVAAYPGVGHNGTPISPSQPRTVAEINSRRCAAAPPAASAGSVARRPKATSS
jgi:glycosyltransferase involved in cell wall biosynthesis/peptidoglycan/xylan/chitin deacetylase (PgdA/CDA1 family)